MNISSVSSAAVILPPDDPGARQQVYSIGSGPRIALRLASSCTIQPRWTPIMDITTLAARRELSGAIACLLPLSVFSEVRSRRQNRGGSLFEQPDPYLIQRQEGKCRFEGH